MYAGPSKRAASKAMCPTCHLRIACRFLSSSPPLAAKRDRKPAYVRQARSNAPGSLSNVIDAKTAPVGQKTKPHYISPDLATGLQRLGFYSIATVVDILRELSLQAAKISPLSAFSAITTQQRFIHLIEGALGSAEVALLRDPKVLRKALHLLGQNYFHERNRFGAQGLEILRMVFLAGELDAGVDTAAAEMLVNLAQAQKERKLAPGPLHSPRIFEFIKAKALAKSDWRATSLYLKEMSQLPRTRTSARDCYQLAKELYGAVEPSKQLRLDNPWLLQHYEAPWKLFYEAARRHLQYLPKGDEHDAVQADVETALRDGLYVYTDPSAVGPALRNPKVIPTHSKIWIDFATQSAAAGDKLASFELAVYHLKKDGWLPKVPGLKPTKRMGLEWLAVSAALTAPDTSAMFSKYLGLAFLLREHGFVDEGRAWLQYAKENFAEAGLDPDREWEAEINLYERTWKDAEEDETMEKHVKRVEEFFLDLVPEQDKAAPPL